MLEKGKKWVQNKIEKGKEVIERNKTAISFAVGMGVMSAAYIIMEKLDEPKAANIVYVKEMGNDSSITARIYYKNRFGIVKNLLNIEYGKDDMAGLRSVADDLNKIVYPKD